jgi:hypothetical protein
MSRTWRWSSLTICINLILMFTYSYTNTWLIPIFSKFSCYGEFIRQQFPFYPVTTSIGIIITPWELEITWVVTENHSIFCVTTTKVIAYFIYLPQISEEDQILNYTISNSVTEFTNKGINLSLLECIFSYFYMFASCPVTFHSSWKKKAETAKYSYMQ